MPTITLSIKYSKNQNMVMSIDELMAIYFYGIGINSTDGTSISDQTKKFYLNAAQQEIERYLDIKFFYQLFSEQATYFRDDYGNQFPFFKTSLPVSNARTLIGRLNGSEQIRYPEEWLVNYEASDNRMHRQFSVVPNGSVVNANAEVILTGVSSNFGIRSYPTIPYYWYVQYETGWKPTDIPEVLINMVGKLASIGLFNLGGDLIIGAGIASQSLSIDGLSQSIATTSSAENSGYSARIKQYMIEVKETMKRLRNSFTGIRFAAC